MKVVTQSAVSATLPRLDPEANKFSRGLCDVVAGSETYPGAAVLAVRAANRLGAGYVRAYVPSAAAQALLVVQPSTVVRSQESFASDVHVCKQGKPCAAVVGCGFVADSEEAHARVLEVLTLTQAPVVVDGGGLSALTTAEGRRTLEWRAKHSLATVITPHGGEASRLLTALGSTRAADGLAGGEAAEWLADNLQVTVVLKGPQTFISRGGAHESTSVFRDGSPCLAKAGTGDILAGCVGALLSCGMPVAKACEAAVCIHAAAADCAASRLAPYCVTAEDVVDNLGVAFQMIDRLGTGSEQA